MKKRTKEILLAVFLGAIVPAVLFRVIANRFVQAPLPEIPTQEATMPTVQETPAQQISVYFQDGDIRVMDLEEYITGVVLAEMPVTFEVEALKAQAVVARTYALKRTLEDSKHPMGAVCTDPSCCQAYKDPLEQPAEHYKRVRDAVMQTEGVVLTYGGSLIEATYFSCSGGRTEDAQAVWGQAVPYLVSVDSPGEEHAEHYVDSIFFTTAEFCALLGISNRALTEYGIGTASHTSGGGIDIMQIGDKDFSGTQVRQLLDLRSTVFYITVAGDTVTVTSKGYGHRVGMSQYGADAMAVAGNSYDQILSHYYPGTELVQWQDN